MRPADSYAAPSRLARAKSGLLFRLLLRGCFHDLATLLDGTTCVTACLTCSIGGSWTEGGRLRSALPAQPGKWEKTEHAELVA